MDENRIAGATQKFGGSAKDALGGALGDSKLQAEGKVDKAAGTVRNAAGGTEDALRDFGDDVQGELGKLRSQVARLMEERVTPALAEAADTAGDYARQARVTVGEQSERVSGIVRDRPLLSIGLIAALGFVLGRLAGQTTYLGPRR